MTLSFLAVFTAGVLTVLSPCVLPLAPILVGGLVVGDDVSRWARLRATLWFALGFAVVFVLLGLGVSALTDVVRPLRPLLLAGAAAILMLYGLRMMHAVDGSSRLAWMDRTFGLRPGAGGRHAIVLGAIFGLTWTPCAGPILGGVLTYVAAGESGIASGGLLLLAYAAGVATPLLLIAAASEYVTTPLRRLTARLQWIELASGAGLVALGLVVLLQARPTAQTSPMPTAIAADRHDGGLKHLLFFHSEHCPVCRALEATLPAVVAACRSDRWTLERIDVDRTENASTMKRYRVHAVPTMSLVDERGGEIAHLVGYQSAARLRETLEHGVQIACTRGDGATVPDLEPADEHTCDIGRTC